jgi:hypothetical protein
LQFTACSTPAVVSVDTKNNTKPAQFSRPRMPAAAPAKHAARNLVVLIAELAMTLGAYMRCAAITSEGVVMLDNVEEE